MAYFPKHRGVYLNNILKPVTNFSIDQLSSFLIISLASLCSLHTALIISESHEKGENPLRELVLANSQGISISCWNETTQRAAHSFCARGYLHYVL